MPAPFYNAIKGTSSGAAGTGAFTPTTPPSDYRPWSFIPSGWIGLVRYADGAAWELCLSYWNGTTLSRASTQIPHNPDGTLQTSTGSQLSLTSAATAAMAVDASDVMSHIGTTSWRGAIAFANNNGFTQLGLVAVATGTAAAVNLATTNYLTEQPRVQYTSATTVNAQAGWSSTAAVGVYSTAAGHGGFEFTARFGASQLPTAPRLLSGLTTVTFLASTAEPSAIASAHIAAFAKDSTDTNIQLLTRDGTTANKVDTGIAWVANGWYETCVWAEPGGGKIYGLLIRLDTGAIWLSSTTTNLPANGSLMLPNALGGLNGTNTGTAVIQQMGSMIIRTSE